MKRSLCVVCLASACIIPDREITFEGGPENPSAVRILERTPLPQEMHDICNADPNKSPGLPELTFCPDVRGSLPSGLVRANDGGPFCICPSGDERGRDLRAIPAFTIYAEDADVVGDSPRDQLRGVFLLDPDPVSEEPDGKAAFNKYWSLGHEGELVPVAELGTTDRTSPSEARDPVPQWRFRIDDGSGTVDFCNGADEIDPGVHDLQFMVTDRPWFVRPFDGDEDVGDGHEEVGVPDTAKGATYAVTNYVFECVDRLDEEDPRSDQCACEE